MSTVLPQYPFDPTGLAVSNKVTETQAIESRGMFDHYYIIPRSGPFYAESVRLRLYPVGANVNNPAGGTPLEEGVHFNFGYHFAHASHTIGKPVYGAISFYDRDLVGQLRMEYQSLGGDWVLDNQKMSELLLNVAYNPRIATWEQVVELPHQFPVVNHDFNIDDFVGMGEVVDTLEDITKAIEEKTAGGQADHVNNKNNPHEVTKDQVGLGLVDNFPTAAVAEAIGGTANNRFMTPLRTKQLIDAVATVALNAHVADKTNPHEVTKAQVGLGNVQNYALPSQAEAEAGASNARYMTPLRTREAIEAIVGVAFAAHANNRTNPHGVTKAQVGLGNVPNIGVATDASALQGIADDGIITPRLLSMVLSETVGEGVTDHIANASNPHGVTKAQVGLGSVQNYGIASEAEARDATSNLKYMTPLAVRYAVAALVGEGGVGDHITNFENPHHVTAAQVGTYTAEELDVILADKLDDTAPAADALAIFGMSQGEVETWIGGLRAGNSALFDGKTYAQATADILSGKAADAAKLDGKSYAEIAAAIGSAVESGNFQHTVPPITPVADELGDIREAPEHWLKIGKYLQPLDYQYGDLTLLITGGRDEDSETERHHTVLFEMSTTNDYPVDGMEYIPLLVRAPRVKHMTPAEDRIELGYVITDGVDVTRPFIDIYIRTRGQRTGWTVTELSNKYFVPEVFGTIDEVEDLVTVEPTGIVYPPVITDGSEEIKALQTFAARTDNPHQVTKAQVGLGSVPNYPAASSAEALGGTATNRLMTPATTQANVNQAIDALCNELSSVIDTAMPLFA
jgi:hypothetical protein